MEVRRRSATPSAGGTTRTRWDDEATADATAGGPVADNPVTCAAFRGAGHGVTWARSPAFTRQGRRRARKSDGLRLPGLRIPSSGSRVPDPSGALPRTRAPGPVLRGRRFGPSVVRGVHAPERPGCRMPSSERSPQTVHRRGAVPAGGARGGSVRGRRCRARREPLDGTVTCRAAVAPATAVAVRRSRTGTFRRTRSARGARAVGRRRGAGADRPGRASRVVGGRGHRRRNRRGVSSPGTAADQAWTAVPPGTGPRTERYDPDDSRPGTAGNGPVPMGRPSALAVSARERACSRPTGPTGHGTAEGRRAR